MHFFRNISTFFAVAIGLSNLSPQCLQAQAFSSPVRDVDNSARQPIFFSPALPTIPEHVLANDAIPVNVYQVPAGKRLVITYIGYYGLGGAFRAITVTAHPADKNQPITSQAVAQCTLLSDGLAMASQQVFVFGNPGDQIDVALHADANATFTGAMIVGYLVNLP